MMENIIMDQELQEELQDTPTGFCVDNDVKADWTLRKIAEIQAERDRMVDFHERQIEVTKAQAEMRINYLMEHLRRYTACVPMKETKTQSKYSLPSGDLVLKKPSVAFRRDDEKLLKWLKESDNGGLIAVKMSPAWAEIKKQITVVDGKAVLTDTGEIIDGVEPYMTEAELVIRQNKEE